MDKPEALRLADELEEAAGEYWRFQKSTGYGAAAELRRLSAVEAQRDALLELVVEMDQHEGAEGWSEDLRVKIDAAIKMAEGENHAKSL
jgi:hypothetical protein